MLKHCFDIVFQAYFQSSHLFLDNNGENRKPQRAEWERALDKSPAFPSQLSLLIPLVIVTAAADWGLTVGTHKALLGYKRRKATTLRHLRDSCRSRRRSTSVCVVPCCCEASQSYLHSDYSTMSSQAR